MSISSTWFKEKASKVYANFCPLEFCYVLKMEFVCNCFTMICDVSKVDALIDLLKYMYCKVNVWKLRLNIFSRSVCKRLP